MPELKQENGVKSQTSPTTGTSPRKRGFDTEPFLGNQTRSKPVPLLNKSQNSQHKIQETDNHSTAKKIEDDNIPPLTLTAAPTEELFRT